MEGSGAYSRQRELPRGEQENGPFWNWKQERRGRFWTEEPPDAQAGQGPEQAHMCFLIHSSSKEGCAGPHGTQ